jgi:integral membrane protein (TIGR00529 family)
MVMSRLMEESGHMGRLVKSFTLLSKDARTVGVVMSALIGLLPMPGGALFSAPMVDASLSGISATSEQKTAMNYWFRHIWEYWWPLYPGVILVVALLEVETWQYMIIAAPLTVVSIIAGIIFILRPIGKNSNGNHGKVTWNAIRRFLFEITPILIVIIVIILITGIIGVLNMLGFKYSIPTLFTILPGLLASIIWVCMINRISSGRIRSAFFHRSIIPMLFLIIAIMIFKGTMEASNAVEFTRNELMAYGIPVMLLIIIMPFLSGFVMGIAVGFVGASFPLIIPLFPTHNLWIYILYAVFAFTFGYMGMMLSPVHLCLLVTKDYFKAGMINSYKYIFKTAFTVLIIVVVIFSLIRSFMF